jgi:hypothetical protein
MQPSYGENTMSEIKQLADIYAVINVALMKDEYVVAVVKEAQRLIDECTSVSTIFNKDDIKKNKVFVIYYKDITKVPARAYQIAIMKPELSMANIAYHCERHEYTRIFNEQSLFPAIYNHLYAPFSIETSFTQQDKAIDPFLISQNIPQPKKKRWYHYIFSDLFDKDK